MSEVRSHLPDFITQAGKSEESNLSSITIFAPRLVALRPLLKVKINNFEQILSLLLSLLHLY